MDPDRLLPDADAHDLEQKYTESSALILYVQKVLAIFI